MPHNEPYAKVDEKIDRKRSIPAQIVLWVVVLGLLYAFYCAFTGHSIFGGHTF